MVKRRQTKQRTLIVDFLKNSFDHPDAAAVYEAVRKDLPTITLATVYRNLHLLVEEGLVTRLEADGGYRFDAHKEHHQHGICNKCGRIFDFKNENISRYALKHLTGDDFEPVEVQVIYRGTCKQCA